ncbi:hypothetical protein Avbf_02984 [Armadillidium vulgare]|nr:hypothetical protein Avbf_02984 [Armadillidium vulgare]
MPSTEWSEIKKKNYSLVSPTQSEFYLSSCRSAVLSKRETFLDHLSRNRVRNLHSTNTNIKPQLTLPQVKDFFEEFDRVIIHGHSPYELRDTVYNVFKKLQLCRSMPPKETSYQHYGNTPPAMTTLDSMITNDCPTLEFSECNVNKRPKLNSPSSLAVTNPLSTGNTRDVQEELPLL